MYADVNFLMALLKEKDWLKERAEKILRMHSKEIWTSTVALQEILLIAKREGVLEREVIERVGMLVEIRETTLSFSVLEVAIALMDDFGVKTFDALHAAIASGHTIISSDAVYDKLGMERLKLEAVK